MALTASRALSATLCATFCAALYASEREAEAASPAAPDAGSAGTAVADAPEGPVADDVAEGGTAPSETAATDESAGEAPSPDASEKMQEVRPPRIDGGYYGGTFLAGATFARVMRFDTPSPFVGGGASFRAGDVVYPWMSIGVEVMGAFASASTNGGQKDFSGQLLIDTGFYPMKSTHPLSLRAAFGFGGGRVTQADGKRSGFGGAAFRAAARYEFFPGAQKYRARRGGGLGIGPELAYVINPPARSAGPMAQTIYLAFTLTWYRGR